MRFTTLLRSIAGRPALRTPPRPGRQELGRLGENAAARLLRRARYRVLARNVRTRSGEADLVCLAPDRSTLVIVEVKTRLLVGEHPPPEASVDAHKRLKLRQVRRALIRANRWQDRPVRIDVVAVDWPDEPRARPSLRHYIAAVEPD